MDVERILECVERAIGSGIDQHAALLASAAAIKHLLRRIEELEHAEHHRHASWSKDPGSVGK